MTERNKKRADTTDRQHTCQIALKVLTARLS
jgi:hypothetical protein